jgi:DNA sulfur modification protein DndB
MANKTIVPAFRASVGDWEYYICIMKYAEVARNINFSYELRSSKDLNDVVQRGIGERTTEITNYLIESEHRFLGALICAVWGGAPQYQPLSMEDSDGILSGIDRQFGVITFDGSQSYFALDGQHRLRAIKDALKQKPELGNEEICVILVPHFDSEEGKKRTRRLFTNINRNAKSTTASENIALDEDDGAAIITRRLISEHPIFKRDGFVKIYTRVNDEGDMKLAGLNIPITDPKAFTTIGVLYELVRSMSFDLSPEIRAKSARPSTDDLDDAYAKIANRFDQLLDVYQPLITSLLAGGSARDLRAPKAALGSGHPLMRPVIQRSVCRVINQLRDQKILGYDEILKALKKLPTEISSYPWSVVFNSSGGKMISSKENANLLDRLIYCHIAPPSKEEIKRVRKLYKELKAENYPVDEDTMAKLIKAHQTLQFEQEDGFAEKLEKEIIGHQTNGVPPSDNE